jgi:hypothetical protein
LTEQNNSNRNTYLFLNFSQLEILSGNPWSSPGHTIENGMTATASFRSVDANARQYLQAAIAVLVRRISNKRSAKGNNPC